MFLVGNAPDYNKCNYIVIRKWTANGCHQNVGLNFKNSDSVNFSDLLVLSNKTKRGSF